MPQADVPFEAVQSRFCSNLTDIVDYPQRKLYVNRSTGWRVALIQFSGPSLVVGDAQWNHEEKAEHYV